MALRNIDGKPVDLEKKIETSIRSTKDQTGHICKELAAFEKEMLALFADSDTVGDAADKIIKAFDATKDSIIDATGVIDAEAEDITDELLLNLDTVIEERNELKGALNEFKENDEGFAKIKIGTLQQLELLEEFVTSQIWPNYNEQRNCVIL